MAKSVAFVLFDGAEELDFVGPWEVFTMVNAVAPGEVSAFTVAETAGLITCAKGMQVVAQYDFGGCPPASIVVIPGGRGTRTERNNPAMLEFVKRMDAQAEYTTSVCTGALVLQSAGLLQGLKATTHWGSIDLLRRPGDCEVLHDARFVDNGHILTAAGVSAGIDMALHLAARIWGPKVAMETQKAMEYYPEPPRFE